MPQHACRTGIAGATRSPRRDACRRSATAVLGLTEAGSLGVLGTREPDRRGRAGVGRARRRVEDLRAAADLDDVSPPTAVHRRRGAGRIRGAGRGRRGSPAPARLGSRLRLGLRLGLGHRLGLGPARLGRAALGGERGSRHRRDRSTSSRASQPSAKPSSRRQHAARRRSRRSCSPTRLSAPSAARRRPAASRRGRGPAAPPRRSSATRERSAASAHRARRASHGAVAGDLERRDPSTPATISSTSGSVVGPRRRAAGTRRPRRRR